MTDLEKRLNEAAEKATDPVLAALLKEAAQQIDLLYWDIAEWQEMARAD